MRTDYITRTGRMDVGRTTAHARTIFAHKRRIESCITRAKLCLHTPLSGPLCEPILVLDVTFLAGKVLQGAVSGGKGKMQLWLGITPKRESMYFNYFTRYHNDRM